MAEHKETYKGREIVVRAAEAPRAAGHGEGEPEELEVLIDGEPIQVFVAEDGSYESHDFMFRVFGSPAELARAKIDQMPAK